MLLAFIFIGYQTHGDFIGITVTELVENKVAYNKTKIAVIGIVAVVEEKVSIRGNIYYTTTLTDGTNYVNIFSFGKPDVTEGQYVRVIGYYTITKYLYPWTFDNELDLIYGNIDAVSDVRKSDFKMYFQVLRKG